VAEPDHADAGPAAAAERLSTAVFDGAVTSTRSPAATAWRITSTSVRVLPVPGGPWISAT
jgi:hypothetical protein